MVRDEASRKLESAYRASWPLRVRIMQANPHGLPVGKEFPFARRKEGDASPFLIEIKVMWPSVHDQRFYQMREDEVEVLELSPKDRKAT